MIAMPPTQDLVVTDAGLETWLVFDRSVELNAFAAYPLAGTTEGRMLLTEYFEGFVDIAEATGAALVLEAPTWRANPEWAASLGHDNDELAHLIRASVDVVDEVRRNRPAVGPFLVGGAIGPRGDGYVVDRAMSADQAAEYHSFQIGVLAATPTDVVTAMTLAYVDEAIGISRAAAASGLPAVISFTVETDGRLPTGISLRDAIEQTDEATNGYPTHYMVNCAHPTHFDHVLVEGGTWTSRIGAVRANASMLSHAELDEATVLDDGDPSDLAARYLRLRDALPSLHVVGGCCGTDHRHVAAIATAFAGPVA